MKLPVDACRRHTLGLLEADLTVPTCRDAGRLNAHTHIGFLRR
jgi:hypothetical protein